jgi:hypothetical protein
MTTHHHVSLSRRIALFPHQARAFLRRARPNRIGEGRLAIVSLTPAGIPERAWQPFRAAQIVGGRRWPLSVLRTGELASYEHGRAPIDRGLVEEALDLLEGEHFDPSEATTVLRRALRQNNISTATEHSRNGTDTSVHVMRSMGVTVTASMRNS